MSPNQKTNRQDAKAAKKILSIFFFLFLALPLPSLSRAWEFDSFAPDFPLEMEPLPLLGSTCFAPIAPAELASRMDEEIAHQPDQSSLYLARAHADFALGNFDKAEADLKTFIEKTPARSVALGLLADFYRIRLQPQLELKTLDQLVAELAKDPKKNKAAIASAISSILETAQAQAIPIDRSSYRRKFLELFPDDDSAALAYLAERSRTARLPQVREEILAFAKKFPDRSEPFYTLLAHLYREQGDEDQAQKVFLDRIAPDSPLSWFTAFFDFLREGDEYDDFKREAESRAGQGPDRDRALIFHLYLLEENSAAAEKVLAEWMQDEPTPSLERLRLFSDYFLRLKQPEPAARLYYAGLQRAGKDQREPWLFGLFQSLLLGKRPAFPMPAGISGFFFPETLDPDPGFSGGVLSLLLNHLTGAPVLSEIAEVEGRHRNFALAFSIREAYRRDFPQGRRLAEMDFLVIERLAELQFREQEISAADEFRKAHPEDERLNRVLRKKAQALAVQRRFPEVKAQYDELLDRTFADAPLYLEILSEYAATLERNGLAGDMVGGYWRELKKHPERGEIYEQFLQVITRLSLSDEEISLYREAAARLKNAGWYSRLARWYLRAQMRDRYDETVQAAIAQLPEAELPGFLAQALPEQFDAKATALKAALFLAAHRRYPRRPEYIQTYLQLTASLYPTATCAGPDCSDPVLDFCKQTLMDDHRLHGNISATLLSRLAKTGQLLPAVALLKAKSSPNLAEQYFLALALDRLGRFEAAAPNWEALANRYPATGYFSEELAERQFGLFKSQPENFAKAGEGALSALTRLHDLYPGEERYPIRIGEMLAESGRVKSALEWWKKLAGQAPGSSSSYLSAATLAWDYYQYREAADLLQAGRKKLNSPALFCLERGAVLEDRGDLPGALQEYVNGLSGDTAENYELVSRLVFLARERGQGPAIVQAFTAKIKERPQSRGPVQGYVSYLSALEERDTIGPVLIAAAGRIPAPKFLRWALAVARSAGPAQAQEVILKKLTAVAPSDFQSWLDLIVLYARENRPAELLAAAGRMEAELQKSRRSSDRVTWFVSLANALWAAGERDLAVKCLRRALESAQGDETFAVSRELASRLLEAGQYEEAAKLLLAQLTDHGWDAGAFTLLASAHAKTGNAPGLGDLNRRMKKLIADTLKRPAERKAALSDLHYGTATALAQAQQSTAALDYYIEWLNLAPADEERLREVWIFARLQKLEDRLLKYYEDTAAKANKDYRWSLVQGRLLSFQGDRERAAAAYANAIRNEPGLALLYREAVTLAIGQGVFSGAAQMYEQLMRLEPGESKWPGAAVNLRYLADEESKAEAVIARMIKPGGSYRRFFAAARALEASGRPAAARPLLKKGLDQFLADAQDVVLDRDLVDDLSRMFAEAGKLQELIPLLSDAHAELYASETKSENKFIKGRFEQSRGNIESTFADTLASAFRDYGTREDYAAASQWLAGPASQTAIPLTILYPFADQAGLYERAAELLKKILPRPGLSLPEFWLKRLAFEEVAADFLADPRQRVNALLWLGRESEALDALSTLSGLTASGESKEDDPSLFCELWRLAAKSPREDVKKKYLDANVMVVEKANYFLAIGRPELALRVLVADPRPAWVKSKQLLVRLEQGGYDPVFSKEMSETMRIGDVQRHLDHKWNRDAEPRGHDQAVIMMKFAEYLYRGGEKERAKKILAAAAEDSPRTSAAYRFTGQVMLELGEKAGAKEKFQQALVLEPKDQASRFGLALALAAEGDRTGALKNLQALAGDTASGGADSEPKLYQFWAMLAAGFEPEAYQTLTAWVKREYEDPETRGAAFLGLEAMVRAGKKQDAEKRPASFISLLQELADKDPADSSLAERIIEEKWLADSDLGPLYDHVITRWQKDKDAADEARKWEDQRLDYWLLVNRAADVIKFLDARESGLAPESIPPADVERRARALLKKDGLPAALSYLDSWLARGPETVDRLAVAYRAYCKAGASAEAERFEERIWRRKLLDPFAAGDDYSDYAAFLIHLERTKEAIKVLQNLADHYPDNPATLSQAARGAEDDRARDFSTALRFREQVSRLSPLEAENRVKMIADLCELERFDEAWSLAVSHLESSLTPRGSKLEVIQEIGICLRGEKGKSVADKWSRELEKKAAGSPTAGAAFLLGAALAKESSGQPAEADRLIREALARDPGFAAPLAGSWWYYRDRQPAALMAAMRTGLKFFPDDLRLRYFLALIHVKNNEPEKALALVFLNSDLIAARHLQDFRPGEQELASFLGSDLAISEKLDLIRELAHFLEKQGQYSAAITLVQSVLDYLAPAGNLLHSCARFDSAAPNEGEGYEENHLDDERENRNRARQITIEYNYNEEAIYDLEVFKLKEERDRLEQAEAAAGGRQRLKIGWRLDNDLGWTWLMPELAAPEEWYLGQGKGEGHEGR